MSAKAPFSPWTKAGPALFPTKLEGTAPLLAGEVFVSTLDFTGALVESMASFSIRG